MSVENVESVSAPTVSEFDGQTATVREVTTLLPGVKVNMRDWHLACSSPDGNIQLVSMDVEEKPSEDSGYEIQAGSWRVTPRLGLQSVKFANNAYFETATTRRLVKFFNTFKNKLHVYDLLGIKTKKRGLLLGSIPGVGKSSLINYFASKIDAADKACVLYIDSQDVDYEIVQTMFRKAKPGDGVDFIVLIIEDLGGNDLTHRRHNVDSTLLNFLDGQDDVFKIPTLIVATTNYMDLLGETLNDRPGRFDLVLQVDPPSDDESMTLLESFIKRTLSASERKAIAGKQFTPAYLRECVIRHMLDDISLEEAVEQLNSQRTTSRTKTHQRKKGRNLGFADED